MNRDRIEGHWKQMKGRARKAAGRWMVSHGDVPLVEREALDGKMRKQDRGAPASHSGATEHWRSP